MLCPYLGGLPNFLPLFLDTCRHVPLLDFLILTDQSASLPPLPENVRSAPFSLKELEQRVETELGIRTTFSHGYKLCDLKPMYGLLFKDYLQSYEYWGHSDFDLVLAPSLHGFLSEKFSEGFDVLNLHSQFSHAAFRINRNSSTVNQLFQTSRDWREAVTSERWVGFDECGNKYDSLARNLGAPNSYTKGDRDFTSLTPRRLLEMQDFECMTVVLCRECRDSELRLSISHVGKEGLSTLETLHFDGHSFVDRGGGKWHFYHWVSEKQRRKWSHPKWRRLPSRYFVTQYGFFNAETPCRNVGLHAIRFTNALLAWVHDRIPYTLRQIGARLGFFEPPPPFC